jgi:23S rRNA pseudouridine1911/1915/1917 synthase
MTLNNGYSYQEVLNHHAQGHTTLSYLVMHYPHSDKASWLQRLANTEVVLNNQIARGDEVLQVGQVLVWNRPAWQEASTPHHYDVVYQDEAIAVVNKPSGLPTMPAGGFLVNTLLTKVREQFPEASPIHRLGRATSGLVVFALISDSASRLSKLWRERTVEKHYRALACGRAKHDSYEITTPIGLVEHPRLGTVHAAREGGKASLSQARVLERRTESTLFAIALLTGRPHQIRIHLAAIGHPLVGDPLYGAGRRPLTAALPGEGAYLLHAERLVFKHPVSGKTLDLNAVVPFDLRCSNELSEAGLEP